MSTAAPQTGNVAPPTLETVVTPPAPAPVKTAPVETAPPPAPAGPSLAEYEALKAQAAEGKAAKAALEENNKRLAQVANLLTGKTDEKTAAIPPEHAQQFDHLKVRADRADRTYQAFKLAHEAEAHYPDQIAEVIRDRPEFALDDNGGLKDQTAAVGFMSAYRAKHPLAFKQATQTQTPQAPTPNNRPPTPPNPQGATPVPGRQLTASEINALPRAERMALQAEAIKAAGGNPQSRFHS